MDRSRSNSLVVFLFFFAAAALLIVWSFVVPIFEAPDEPAHWTYARYLHDYQRLPDTNVVAQANYPPLYYLLIAPLAAPTVLPERASDGAGDMQFPPRFYRNTDGDFMRYWPIRLARLASVAISLFGVWWCYLAGREMTGRRETGLLTAGLVAFLPQFTFRGMNVADDVLVTALAALATYLLLRLFRRGFTWPIGIVASLVVAAATLAKISALYFFAPLALALLVAPGTPWRVRPRRLFVLGAGVALLAPWMIRNIALYGDPLAAAAVSGAIADQAVRHALFSRYMFVDLPLHAAKSFIGNFGWQSLGLPWWLYGVYCVGCAGPHATLAEYARRAPKSTLPVSRLGAEFAGCCRHQFQLCCLAGALSFPCPPGARCANGAWDGRATSLVGALYPVGSGWAWACERANHNLRGRACLLACAVNLRFGPTSFTT